MGLARSAIVLIEDGRVALIRRERVGHSPYHLFPGGGVEPGESAEDAAMREAYEEIGIPVRLEGLMAIVEFNGQIQHYFRATRAAGIVGTGNGEEMAAPVTSETGSYTPVWIPPREAYHHTSIATSACMYRGPSLTSD